MRRAFLPFYQGQLAGEVRITLHRPEGGDAGGEVVAAGAPEEIAKDPSSYTGTFLADVLGISRQRRREPVGARA